MYYLNLNLNLILILILASPALSAATSKVVLVVHGGSADKTDLMETTPEMAKEYKDGLAQALRKGYAALKKGSSLDGVETAVRTLEDNPLFNAGKGAVFTHEGKNELDASIMEGKNLSAGAVAGVTTIKNPVTAARAVMEKTRHVMLVTAGAEKFAKEVGLEMVEPSYFHTEKSWKDLQKALEKEKASKQSQFAYPRASHWGTVGAVAVDTKGILAAATSTGGLTNKRFGRVGDSPVIGAGTYADNEGLAVSCTGVGEYFIRYSAAHDMNALLRYKKLSLQQSLDEVIRKKIKNAGGEGAAIGLDAKGNYAFSYNGEGIFHGYITESGKIYVGLFGEKEELVKEAE
jgi:L-asparaginase / beta-aspartyl-peptidase